ncbi:MAG: hypothetical protein IPL65_19245 [Lewinellaceae bacterium]|nr:hypothetical protein [Lewinellaceae bacterium]
MLRDFRPEDGESPFHKNGGFPGTSALCFLRPCRPDPCLLRRNLPHQGGLPERTIQPAYVIERELGNEKEQVNTATQRKRASDVDLIIAPMDIGSTPGGNYVLSHRSTQYHQ